MNVEQLTRPCTDSTVWAKCFVTMYPSVDEEVMHGWFANAMMDMHDASHSELQARVLELEEQLRNSIPNPVVEVRSTHEACNQVMVNNRCIVVDDPITVERIVQDLRQALNGDK